MEIVAAEKLCTLGTCESDIMSLFTYFSINQVLERNMIIWYAFQANILLTRCTPALHFVKFT